MVGAVEELSIDKGVQMSSIALAWVLAKPQVDAPIVGVTSADQLDAALAALDVELSDEDMARLEGPYQLRAPAGF